MESRGILVGIILCILGLAMFAYGMSTVSHLNEVSSLFVIVLGTFIGMAGLLVLAMNLFSRGSSPFA